MKRQRLPALLVRCLTFLGVCNAAPQAIACDCFLLTEEEAFAQAEQVFIGRVTAIREFTEEGWHQLELHFDVDEVEKGEPGFKRLVYTNADSGACGYPVLKSLRYRIFASEFQGRLSTGLCRGNSLVPDGVDRDGDVLPDLWEERHGLHQTACTSR